VTFVLLSLGFLLKYSFDQGWITPLLRLWGGAVVATILLIVGLRIRTARRLYSQILLGGAIAIYYLVAYAGHQFYGLIPFLGAVALTAAVTLLALVLADRQETDSLAVLGVSGGLLSPFLLDPPAWEPSALSVYGTLIMAGAAWGLGKRRGLTLLGTVTLGGAAVVIAAGNEAVGGSRAVVTAAVAVYWLTVGVLPLLGRDPDPNARHRSHDPYSATRSPHVLDPYALRPRLRQIAAGVSVLCAMGTMAATWELESRGAGIVLLVLGGAYGMLAAAGNPGPSSRPLVGELAALIVPSGTALAIGETWGVAAVMGEAATLHWLSRRPGWTQLRSLGHLVVGFSILYLLTQSPFSVESGPFGISAVAAASLLSIAVVALTSRLLAEPDRGVYRLLAYGLLLWWTAAELSPRSNGTALVSIAWGIQGATLLVASFGRSQGGQVTALATLALVAMKLLVVDLAQLDVIWRILLFMGFGAAFLALGYLMRRPRLGRSTGSTPGRTEHSS
jgi:hypothetical protein